MTYPKISIIIPAYKTCGIFYENIKKCLLLDYPDYEVLIVTDGSLQLPFKDVKIKVLCTGQRQTGPAEKRDFGLQYAEGKIIAFMDNDAYPNKDWLKNALDYFEEREIVALGGPMLTPPEDSLMEKASGMVLSSIFGSGVYVYRYSPRKERLVDDYPGCNLFINKTLLKKIGGFNSKFYGGEDSKLCLEIVRKGEKILYVPDVIVYHHCRPLFKKYARQIGNYAKHRGYFVKKYPQTSRRICYFLPSLFLLSVIAGVVISTLNALFFRIFLATWVAYLVVFWLIGGIKSRDIRLSFLFPFGILVTHLTYGFAFLKGLLLRHLEV